jgi:myosin-5
MCEKLFIALWTDTCPPIARRGSNNLLSSAETTPTKQAIQGTAATTPMMQRNVLAKESLQLGLTKVFLRKSAHDLLESRRSRRIIGAVKKIQCHTRRYFIRCWYLDTRASIIKLQRMIRELLFRRKAFMLRRIHAVVSVQAWWRGRFYFIRYRGFLSAVIKLQSRYRGVEAKALISKARLLYHTIRLQKVFRGLYQRHKWIFYRNAVLSTQCRWRSLIAKRKLRVLRIAAKDLGTLQQSNAALKAEIDELRERAAEEKERVKVCIFYI